VLHVRHAGQDGLRVNPGVVQQRLLEAADLLVQSVDRLAEVEAGIRGDLIIAAAGGMELAGDGSDLLSEAAFDPGVDVLCAFELAEGRELGQDRLEAGLDESGLVDGDDAGVAEHPAVRDGAANVMSSHALVERKGGCKDQHRRVRPRAKSATP
jgi:hypothetical protein